ncbi:MAG: metallopeptidase TldD-related protein, partial [Pseudomonadales bacterium]|nr:metallopeptidase TldD-related protein [Pseudomonadales bacterium]
MNEVVATVEKQLLQAKGMSLSDIEHSIGTLLGREIDYGEVFIQSTRGESFGLEDGIVKDGSFGVEAGIGVRALAGEKTGFAYSEDIRLDGLQEAAKAAQSIAGAGAPRNLPSFRVGGYPSLYAAIDPISSLSDEEKVSLLRRVDQVARAQDPRVQEVNVRISGNHETMLVMASDGTLAADIRPLVRFDVSVIVEHNGRRERGNAGGGGRRSLDSLAEGEWTDNLAKEAVRMALVNLEAVDAPAGPMPVVLGPGWPGVLLHEAVGHGLEGDFNRKGSSAFSNRVGEQVASPLCTVVDDGTLEARRGSLSVDDEGTQTQMTTLIENGVLKGYMQDKLNARLMNVA